LSETVREIVRWVEGDDNSAVGQIQRMARFVFPPNAIVAVVTSGDDRLLNLRLRRSFEFPTLKDQPSSEYDNDASLIADIEAVKAQGAHFFFVPSMARGWFEGHSTFKTHVENKYRTVIEEGGSAAFALQDDNLPSPGGGIGPDGLPLPPVEMVRLTSGLWEDEMVKLFYNGGAKAAAWMRDVLRRSNLDLEDFQSILDFGCGCGRIMRQWQSLRNPQLYGTDYNPFLIRWCRENLPFASFAVNGMDPTLDYLDEQFDFIYSVSVFTHLVEPLQIPWATELVRLLRPGGHLLFTTHGRGRLDLLDEEGQATFKAGRLVTAHIDKAGTNACAAFHPETYVRDEMAETLAVDLVGFYSDAATAEHQDVVLFRKPDLL
jgi:SAM-dependent methyltransferase